MIEESGPLTEGEIKTLNRVCEEIRPRLVSLIKGARILIENKNYTPAYAMIVSALEETLKYHVCSWAIGSLSDNEIKRKFINQLEQNDHDIKQRAAFFQLESQFRKVIKEKRDMNGREKIISDLVDSINQDDAKQLEWCRQHSLYVGFDWKQSKARIYKATKKESTRLFEIAREYAYYYLTTDILGSSPPYQFTSEEEENALKLPLAKN